MPEALPRGSVKALKALSHRVPEGTAPEAAQVADEAFGTLVEVMRGNVKRGARERLSAAAAIREEVCGAVPKQHNVNAQVATTIVVSTGVTKGPPGGES